ncbi:MAG: permease-like cell division protein FtsX [Salinivirgaceae bacterium]|jgi:cell division transport system permease protein|nr:permease-like cell division protein FtsX [Salinivirgaceae bacterium]
MKPKEEKASKRRLRTSYITTVVSITLVLFILGLMGLLVLNAKKLSDYVRENIGFSIILKDEVKEPDVLRLQKIIESKDFVKATAHISKAQAAQELQADLGEDFIDFIGYNPLPVSIEVKLVAEYANNDSIRGIERNLGEFHQIKEVWYQKSLVHLMNENIRKISLILLGFSALLLLISIVLINNTIRLSVYSKRFLINTMRLVGATRFFIRGPFLRLSMVHGFISGIFANALMFTVIYFIGNEFPEITFFNDLRVIVLLTAGIVLIGISISTLSTLFAVNKYLRISTDKLYF